MCDDGTFAEYGPLVIAGQRQRRSLDDLINNTPADGFVCGFGEVNTHRTAINVLIRTFRNLDIAATPSALI